MRLDRSDERHGPISGRPLSRCPACESSHLVPVVEGEDATVHFFCCDCAACWSVNLGAVWRQRPDACSGCPRVAECRAAIVHG
jgi:hypothetical protein